MKKIWTKFLVIILVTIILIINVLPTVHATYEELQNLNENATLENTIIEQNLMLNSNTNKNTDNINNFKVLLAGVLSKNDVSFKYSDVDEIISSVKFSGKGVWVSEKSRDYIIKLVNSISNANYIINENGFLIIDEENLKKEEQLKEEYVFFTTKLNELINSTDKIIILSIEKEYKNLNVYDNDILNMIIEDEEYALLFNNEDVNSNISNIVILNDKNYNFENKIDSSDMLMKKMLEPFFYEDEDFIDKKENIETDDNSTDSDSDITEIEEDIQDAEESNEENLTNASNEEIELSNPFDDKVTEEQYRTILAGMITDDLSNKNIDDIIENNISRNNGIWISNDSRNDFINFINKYTIYTYSVDSEGFLVCDNIMKDNPNLDALEKYETEIDLEIKNILNSEKLIILGIKDTYKYLENNDIVTKDVMDLEFRITFSNENNRIILLNRNYYLSDKYDLGLSDYFVKSLNNIEEKVYTGQLTLGKPSKARSDTSKPGYMYSAQNVYAGPSSSDYAKLGSVDANEKVYLLGQTVGWYHIQYMVTNSSIQKSGFVPVDTVNSNGHSVHEEQMTGGQRYTNHGIAVQSCDDFDISTQIGSIYDGEGVTLLYTYRYIDSGKSYNAAFVEFSTATGTKRGYMYADQLDIPSYPTSIARVTDVNSAYSGPDSSYVKLGGAYFNEYVSIIAKEGDWVLTEYNTTAGRKRGFMSYLKLSNCNYPEGGYADFPAKSGIYKATKQLAVYGGPNSNYANIGTIFNEEVITAFTVENGYRYIEYSTANGAKRGFVDNNFLSETTAPSLPNLSTYSNFSSEVYGASGLGTQLKYYKIGNGANVLFAVFEQHGWEDAWAFDGLELVKIADRMMKNLSNTGISNNWTLYVIPYANPDGITNGYTNNGPGRCTITTQLDMNRSWPANFVQYTDSRNKTGPSALGPIEVVHLKKFLESHESLSGTTVLLDIHGWLDITYGDSEVGTYFNQQFGNSHRSVYGSGYLETWGKQKGYKSCLVELPMPSSASSIISNDYSGKVTRAIINLTNNLKTLGEAGEEVNETVKISSTGNVNIRLKPTTSSSIVATIGNGTILTRTRKSVAIANGYTWDKVVLNDGTQGYIATNFLKVIGEMSNYNYGIINNDIYAVKAYLKLYDYLPESTKPDNCFDNQLFDAIENFQKLKNLTISGELTVETLNEMGFETNNGIIVQNAYYKNFRGIADIYLSNSKSSVIFNYDYGVREYVFGKNRSYAGDRYYSHKQTEDNNYNSMNATEKASRYEELSEIRRKLVSLSEDYGYLVPNASRALKRYTDNTGNTLALDITSMFDISAINSTKNTCIERCMQSAETFLSGDVTVGKFALNVKMDMEISSSLSLDWFLAAHEFKWGNDAVVTRDGNNYNMILNIRFKDYYDWDDDNNYFVFPGGNSVSNIKEKDIRALHYAGLSKNYETTGVYPISIEWSKGQSIDQAKITTY